VAGSSQWLSQVSTLHRSETDNIIERVRPADIFLIDSVAMGIVLAAHGEQGGI